MSDPTSEEPRLAARRNMSPAIWGVLLLSLLYVGSRVRDDWRAKPDVWASAQKDVRNALFEINDLLRERQRRGEALGEAFVPVATDVSVRRGLAEYSLYLTPELAVHGTQSRMPREKRLSLWGRGAPAPSYDAERWTYLIVAVRPTGQAKNAEVWTIDSNRDVMRGRYWLAE